MAGQVRIPPIGRMSEYGVQVRTLQATFLDSLAIATPFIETYAEKLRHAQDVAYALTEPQFTQFVANLLREAICVL